MKLAREPMIILIRSHYIDARLAKMVRRIADSTKAGVYLVLDERMGPIPCEPLQKISLNDGAIANLELGLTDDYAWRCGDYALFIARSLHPDEDVFWMIEHDVRVNFEDPAEFFNAPEGRQYDFLATHFGEAALEWAWRPSMAHYENIYQCLFSLIRISGRALDFLSPLRRTCPVHSRLGLPNDEAFVATSLMAGGFSCADISVLGEKLYDWRTFSFSYPISGKRFDQNWFDQRLYHPVLYGDAFFRKAVQKLSSLPEAQRVPALIADIESECGSKLASIVNSYQSK